MPRPAKGARLYLRKRKGRQPVYIIREAGRPDLSTGVSDIREAERALAAYIADRETEHCEADPQALTIAAALALYGERHAPGVAAPARIGYAIDALHGFFGDHTTLAEITPTKIRAYIEARGRAPATVRRELGVLRSALNFCVRDGIIDRAPRITLPEAGARRERYLTRTEAAYLLWAARRLRVDGRHLAHFILIGLYTGTRKAAALNLRLDRGSTGSGWIDTENGILYRTPWGARRTAKRQPTTRIPVRILAHARRWRSRGDMFAVQDHLGRRIGDIKKGWQNACKLGTEKAVKDGLDIDLTDATPHVLRHTAITWALQAGSTMWDVAGYFGASYEIIERVYGHHSPGQHESVVFQPGRRKA